MSRRTLKDLSCDAVDEQSRHVDWSRTQHNEDDGDGETAQSWQSWEASACDACGAVLVFNGGGGDESHRSLAHMHDDDDEREKARDCDGHVPLVEGPQMNYFWPADFDMDNDDAARAIAHLPLCVVELDGEKGLALTGGGMDLSWEIAEAYLCLGLYPPATIRLPEYCGRPNARAEWIIGGLRASLRIRANWTRQSLRSLRRIAAHVKEQRATARNKAQA